MSTQRYRKLANSVTVFVQEHASEQKDVPPTLADRMFDPLKAYFRVGEKRRQLVFATRCTKMSNAGTKSLIERELPADYRTRPTYLGIRILFTDDVKEMKESKTATFAADVDIFVTDSKQRKCLVFEVAHCEEKDTRERAGELVEDLLLKLWDIQKGSRDATYFQVPEAGRGVCESYALYGLVVAGLGANELHRLLKTRGKGRPCLYRERVKAAVEAGWEKRG